MFPSNDSSSFKIKLLCSIGLIHPILTVAMHSILAIKFALFLNNMLPFKVPNEKAYSFPRAGISKYHKPGGLE